MVKKPLACSLVLLWLFVTFLSIPNVSYSVPRGYKACSLTVFVKSTRNYPVAGATVTVDSVGRQDSWANASFARHRFDLTTDSNGYAFMDGFDLTGAASNGKATVPCIRKYEIEATATAAGFGSVTNRGTITCNNPNLILYIYLSPSGTSHSSGETTSDSHTFIVQGSNNVHSSVGYLNRVNWGGGVTVTENAFISTKFKGRKYIYPVSKVSKVWVVEFPTGYGVQLEGKTSEGHERRLGTSWHGVEKSVAEEIAKHILNLCPMVGTIRYRTN